MTFNWSQLAVKTNHSIFWSFAVTYLMTWLIESCVVTDAVFSLCVFGSRGIVSWKGATRVKRWLFKWIYFTLNFLHFKHWCEEQWITTLILASCGVLLSMTTDPSLYFNVRPCCSVEMFVILLMWSSRRWQVCLCLCRMTPLLCVFSLSAGVLFLIWPPSLPKHTRGNLSFTITECCVFSSHLMCVFFLLLQLHRLSVFFNPNCFWMLLLAVKLNLCCPVMQWLLWYVCFLNDKSGDTMKTPNQQWIQSPNKWSQSSD